MPVTTEEIRIGGLTIRYLLEGSATENSLAMFELEVAAGANVPIPHSHDAYDETIYGLDGTLTITLWNEAGKASTHQVAPAETVFIRRGVVHRFDNLQPTAAKTLCVITPGILSPNYFREIADLVSASVKAATPPNPAAIGEIMRRHGLTPAP